MLNDQISLKDQFSSDLKGGARSKRRSITFVIGVASAIVLMVFVPMEIIVSESGAVVAVDPLQAVPVLAGGQLEFLGGEVGGRVSRGEVIAKLSSEGDIAMVNDLEHRISEALKEQALIDDLVNDITISNQGSKRGHPIDELYVAKQKRQRETMEIFTNKERILEENVRANTLNLDEAKLNVQLKNVVYESRLALEATGVVPAVKVREAALEFKIAEAKVKSLDQDFSNLRQQIALNAVEGASAQAAFKEELATRRAELEKQKNENLSALASYREKVRQKTIASPVEGIVQTRIDRSPGNVVQPGETLFQIMPEGARFEFESSVGPSDIGYINVGDVVNVRIDSFPYWQFGSFKGRISWISNDAIDDTSRTARYKVKIAIDQKAHSKLSSVRLRAGMTGSADIVIGHRAVWEYFMSSVFRLKDAALRER